MLDMLGRIKQQRHAKASDGDMRRAVDLRPMVADEDEDGIVEPRLAAGAVDEIAKGPVGIRGRIRLALLLGILVAAPLRIGIGAVIGEDRKSFVEGKSVAVRVDLGGGRIIKTKKRDI